MMPLKLRPTDLSFRPSIVISRISPCSAVNGRDPPARYSTRATAAARFLQDNH